MSTKDVIGIILGGGVGTRLFPLTRDRTKPAVPLAGKYRLIDIPMSNCFHAGIDKIAILTQYNSVSLHRHIHRTYNRDGSAFDVGETFSGVDFATGVQAAREFSGLVDSVGPSPLTSQQRRSKWRAKRAWSVARASSPPRTTARTPSQRASAGS